MTARDSVPLRHGEWKDHADFSGFSCRADGTICLLIKGRGLILGPMSADDMREIAHHLLATADVIGAREHAAGDAALAELANLTAEGEA
jgi:hypothetical protein